MTRWWLAGLTVLVLWIAYGISPYVALYRLSQAVQAHDVQAANLYFWGQELEIARHAAAAGRALDEGGIRDTIAAFELPLVGPALPDYPEKIRQATTRHMRGRWLPGTAGPAPVAAAS